MEERLGVRSDDHAPAGAASRSPRPARAAAEATYAAFMERRLDDAYRLATYILGDRDEAEDAVHDAAVAAWRHWADRRDEARTGAWFQRIVVNASRDRIRARQRVRSIALAIERGDGSPRVAPDVASVVERREGLEAMLRGVGVDERIVLTLRYGLDLTVPTIAGVLGIPAGTVKSRLHRALALVERHLDGTTR